MTTIRLVLASASPARLATLRQAGLNPEQTVSGVDEGAVAAPTAAGLAQALATLKAETVAEQLAPGSALTVVIGCDSVLELDGQVHGKPGTPQTAVERWYRMRGRSGVLHTGHHVMLIDHARRSARSETASTVVHFAHLSDAEVEAYVATGEPLQVAGGFTVDGLGGPFVSRIEGDHHNVVGISLPLVRTMLADLGVAWPRLWVHTENDPAEQISPDESRLTRQA
ncbi:MAG TPA: Maf family protein [Propionibacteriaceae bacterium]|nr:Maf family protein [Propionibacteriaceae bacterium]